MIILITSDYLCLNKLLFYTHLHIFDSTLTDEFTQLPIQTDTILDNLCLKTRLRGPSCLSPKPKDLLSGNKSAIFSKLLQVLQTLCFPLQLPKENAKETVEMMYAMGMYCRNRELLHILDTILVHCILHILSTILVHCLI